MRCHKPSSGVGELVIGKQMEVFVSSLCNWLYRILGIQGVLGQGQTGHSNRVKVFQTHSFRLEAIIIHLWDLLLIDCINGSK